MFPSQFPEFPLFFRYIHNLKVSTWSRQQTINVDKNAHVLDNELKRCEVYGTESVTISMRAQKKFSSDRRVQRKQKLVGNILDQRRIRKANGLEYRQKTWNWRILITSFIWTLHCRYVLRLTLRLRRFSFLLGISLVNLALSKLFLVSLRP